MDYTLHYLGISMGHPFDGPGMLLSVGGCVSKNWEAQLVLIDAFRTLILHVCKILRHGHIP